jgi:phenylalanyl-tRNA synthetase alpha chain
MFDKVEEIRLRALKDIESADTPSALEDIRIRYLGRKGLLTGILRSIGNLPPQERPKFGKLVNSIKEEIAFLLEQRLTQLKSEEKIKQLKKEDIDVTTPSLPPTLGKMHPVNKVLEEIIDTFNFLGFEVAYGPEIEWSYYNFDALNIPPDHPARDMHDTFYITSKVILRTHTSPVQIRIMKSKTPPIKIIVPGKVYRRDADISHLPMFHQIEGLMIDDKTTFADLKGVLTVFLHRMFGRDTKVRFRPSYFPFTEPSAEVDISCVLCGGSGCRLCKGSGYLEILGAGCVDPEVLKEVDYDPERLQGFAFGLGIERIAMLKYSITDIRLFFENDIRFLKQF